MTRTGPAALVLPLLITLVACGDDATSGDGVATDTQALCAPGQVEACECEPGVAGQRSCRADGAGWEACACDLQWDVVDATDGDGGALEIQDVEADVEACTPGAVSACACEDGSAGTSECAAGGQWSACACEPPGEVVEAPEALEVVEDLGEPPVDEDGDGVWDHQDNCPGLSNPWQHDMDGDGEGDACDGDIDDDGIANEADFCPEAWDPSQVDLDGDGAGDACDVDVDGDGIPNDVDGCPADADPGQEDLDGDGQGDACDPDVDGDLVPDELDEAPTDPAWPGLAASGTIYAHTSGALYRWTPGPTPPELVGGFEGAGGGGIASVTDIAIDVDGRLYAVTFDDLYRCSAVSVACVHLASLSESFNGFTLVPKGTVDPNYDVLIAVANSGNWNRVVLDVSGATIVNLGSYGVGYTSSGDAYAIDEEGCFAAVNKAGVSNDVLVRVDPLSGAVLEEIGQIPGYSSIWGLAGMYGSAYAFDESGAIIELDLTTGQGQVIIPTSQGQAWWGAGVSTRNIKDDRAP